MTKERRVTDADFMERALELAQCAADECEVPVGALLVHNAAIIGEGWNQPVGRCDPTAHAEIVALRAAGRQAANYRLTGATLYVTLEPCAMCIGAALNARVSRVVFGAWDAKAGACGSLIDVPRQSGALPRMDVFGGVLSERSRALLQEFFAVRR